MFQHTLAKRSQCLFVGDKAFPQLPAHPVCEFIYCFLRGICAEGFFHGFQRAAQLLDLFLDEFIHIRGGEGDFCLHIKDEPALIKAFRHFAAQVLLERFHGGVDALLNACELIFVHVSVLSGLDGLFVVK